MNDIDKKKSYILVRKLLKHNPQKFHEIGSNSYYLFFEDIVFDFYSMGNDYLTDESNGILKINNYDTLFIDNETRLLVLKYFRKRYAVEDIISRLDKSLRLKKLKKISNE